MMNELIHWQPNLGPQRRALKSRAFELLYGGARGGGKTDAGMVWMLKCVDNPKFRGLVIRRNSDDLSDWVSRAKVMYAPTHAHFAYRPAEITFPSGAIIRTGHLKDDDAYTKYQGHEYQRILIEELTQIPDENRYIQLMGSCRSTIPDIDPRMFATTNPGGVGHVWVKKRFVDPAPPGISFIGEDNKRTRIFIPAKVEDTPQLINNDPGYMLYLEGLKNTNEELWKAWRLGLWDTFAGQYFAEFRRDLHVIPSFTPNYELKDSTFVSGMDWGRAIRDAQQGSFGFMPTVITPVEWVNRETGDTYRFNRAVTFREFYGGEKRPEDWAREIAKGVPLNKFSWIRADPSMFHTTEDGSISIAKQFEGGDRQFARLMQPANNDRIAGWELVHKWLSIAPDGMPYWLITDNCINLIRTLPVMQHDLMRVEDLDSDLEDHLADTVRYMFMHVPWKEFELGSIATKETYTPRQEGPLTEFDLTKFEQVKPKARNWDEI